MFIFYLFVFPQLALSDICQPMFLKLFHMTWL